MAAIPAFGGFFRALLSCFFEVTLFWWLVCLLLTSQGSVR